MAIVERWKRVGKVLAGVALTGVVASACSHGSLQGQAAGKNSKSSTTTTLNPYVAAIVHDLGTTTTIGLDPVSELKEPASTTGPTGTTSSSSPSNNKSGGSGKTGNSGKSGASGGDKKSGSSGHGKGSSSGAQSHNSKGGHHHHRDSGDQHSGDQHSGGR
ncbi:MAG TPA: hypothetical protein VEJ87_05985 [Acidimicrobiales bacterium]|nr:hypothetical protein [Acidimicrobiales bacterium]